MYTVLLGPPGAGKGTQSDRLEEIMHMPHVASGDLFRENLRHETQLGLLAKTYMDRGNLVPDDVTIAMVRERLSQPDAREGAILDGFPRTLPQAEGLDALLADLGASLQAVLYLSVPDDKLVRRLSGRRICSACQTPYHIDFNPPRTTGVCDECGGQLYQREDDKPGTVRARLKVYYEQTAPLIETYRNRGLLTEIDGGGSLDKVTQAIMDTMRKQ